MKKLFLLYTQNKQVRYYKIINLLRAVCLLLLCASFASLQAKESVLWKHGADYVGYSHVENSEVNEHPFEIDASNVYQILNSIRIQKEDSGIFDLKIFSSKDDYSNEMFTRDELINLSQNISRALINSSSSQDIVFSITGTHEKTLGTADVTTTGRVFYSAGKLNIIIGEFRVDLAQKYRRQGGHSDVAETIDRNKLEGFKLRTGQRNKSIKPDFTFLEDDYQTIHQTANGKRRKDWLEIDVQAALVSYSQPRTTQAEPKPQANNTDSKDYEKLETKVEMLEQRLDQKQAQDTTFKSVNTPKVSIEDRLVELKKLFSKGLIDKEAYNEKMNTILDDL